VPRDSAPTQRPPDGVDPAVRLHGVQRQLRATLQRRETLTALLRDTLGESDPRRVADLLIDRCQAWLPMAGWAVAVDSGPCQTLPLVVRGGRDDLWTGLIAAATIVRQQRALFVSADVSRDTRFPGVAPATMIGFSLVCRGKPIGAIVGVDDPSGRAPRIAPGVLDLLATVLEVGALTLDQAVRLQRAEEMSVTDDLTGLYNSRFLREALGREAKRAIRYGRPIAVLFVDLDGFKLVNDTHGHLLGSRTLVEAGDLIRGCARESDIVARYGGDEFVLVLPDTGTEGAAVVARRICDRMAQHTFLQAEGIGWHLTASVGVAALPDAADGPDALLSAADRAMYHVKESGKNNIRLAPAR